MSGLCEKRVFSWTSSWMENIYEDKEVLQHLKEETEYGEQCLQAANPLWTQLHQEVERAYEFDEVVRCLLSISQ